MRKFTRRLKKYKKNRTVKFGGNNSVDNILSKDDNILSKDDNILSKDDNILSKENSRKGVVDIVENKISDIASSAATTIENAGLKMAGLERISDSNKTNQKVDENIESSASGIVSNVGNVVDKTGSALIENVNEVLGSNAVQETTMQAAEKTADIIKSTAEKFNIALNDPEVKAEVEEAINKAGEVGSVIVKAAEKPLNEALDATSKAIPKATGAALAGIIKVGTDVMAAIPGVGAIIEVGKILNDGSKAASAVVEAGSEAVEVASDAFIETKENVEKGLKLLEEKKRLANQISNRTTQSINEFENPIQTAGRKTKRRLIGRKAKSKRVRFTF